MVERVRGIKGIPSSPLRHPLTCCRSILATNTLYTLLHQKDCPPQCVSGSPAVTFWPPPLCTLCAGSEIISNTIWSSRLRCHSSRSRFSNQSLFRPCERKQSRTPAWGLTSFHPNSDLLPPQATPCPDPCRVWCCRAGSCCRWARPLLVAQGVDQLPLLLVVMHVRSV